MIEYFKIFSLPLLTGKRLALVTRSGGHGVLGGDAAHSYGFQLAELPGRLVATMKKKKANVIRITNPLDVGDMFDLAFYPEMLKMMLGDPGIDGAVFILSYSPENEGQQMEEFVRQVGDIASHYRKPTVVCVLANRETWFAMKHAGDMPVFVDVDEAIEFLAASYAHYLFRKEKPAAKLPAHFGKAVRRRQMASESPVIMDAEETLALLQRYKVPLVDHGFASSRKEAVDVAGRLGYPVALKIVSPQILHKTEAGAVVLDIKGPAALQQAMAAMHAERYLIQKMVPPGREVIIGGKQDEEFGPVLMFGLGGIFTELLKDTVIRVAPIDPAAAKNMIADIKGTALLRGYRGGPPADMEKLAKSLVAVSRLLVENPAVIRLEINPLIVGIKGSGCTAVDARIETI